MNNDWPATRYQVIDKLPWFRADGDIPCKVCNQPYYKHPRSRMFSFLNITCDGLLVKL